jgi:DNA gyrase/topoisomerase IV subunit A
MTTKKTSTPTSDYIKDTSREYSIYVCESRAIPSVADGQKDGPRKALWLMRTRSDKIKTVSLAGEMISSGLYVHGDASASDSISALAAPFLNNVPLFEGIGAFGTRVAPKEGIGAPRYTYVKRAKAAEMLLYKDLDIVPLTDNYDGSVKEPEHFLPLIPLVLLNGVQGIAVGWSTNILPRNLKKLVAATQQVLDGKEPKGLEPYYDYLNVSVHNLEPNVWEFTGRAEIINTSQVKITELPPGMTLDSFRKRLVKMEEEDKIVTFVDDSTKVIDIKITFKRGELKGWTEDDIINYFKLRQRETERIVVIDWNGTSIRQYDSAETLVKEFVEWRLKWYAKRYEKMLDDDNYELKYWQGVKACFDAKLPERLSKKTDKADIESDVSTITTSVGLDASQIDKIVSLPTYRWAKDFLVTVKDNISRLQANVKDYKAILKSPDRIKEIYKQELEELKKLK